ncbi:MAG: GWxTD domain-containing protein, partial [bacterium]
MPSTLFSQLQSSRTQKQLTQGQKLFVIGNFKEAKKAFKRALKSDKNLLAAYAGLGKIAFAEEDWSEVNGQFDKILDRDPNNIEAHYYRGIANREIGKFRPKFANSIPLMNKLLEYQKSKKHFERVLAQDSLFSDVLYQYGLLKRYRDKYKEAIWLAQRQIALKPELVAAQVGLFRIYKYYIAGSGEDAAITWLQEQPWQHAKFFIGEKYRRAKKFELADSVYKELLQEEMKMPVQPIYLAMAKSTYMQDEAELADSYYWQAVENIKNQIEADLVFENIKYIVNDSELTNFRATSTLEEKIDFFRAFWARRDPLPASKNNVRLAEHYRRLVFSEDNYEFSGFRTWVNSADKLKYLKFPATYKLNKEFNDKGLVYLRHGPP